MTVEQEESNFASVYEPPRVVKVGILSKGVGCNGEGSHGCQGSQNHGSTPFCGGSANHGTSSPS